MMDDLSHYLRPPVRNKARGWIVILLCIAAAAWLGMQAYQEFQAGNRVRVRTERLHAMLTASAPKVSRTDAELEKRWAALKLERDFPWQLVFKAVEGANNPNIELLEFQPDKASRHIVLRGEAKDLDALTMYLEALAQQPAWANVHLVHQQAVARDRLETVAFEIRATLAE